jgi:hypothetical protein
MLSILSLLIGCSEQPASPDASAAPTAPAEVAAPAADAAAATEGTDGCGAAAAQKIEVLDVETQTAVPVSTALYESDGIYYWRASRAVAEDCAVSIVDGRLYRVRVPRSKTDIETKLVDLQVYAPASPDRYGAWMSPIGTRGIYRPYYGDMAGNWSYSMVLEVLNKGSNILVGLRAESKVEFLRGDDIVYSCSLTSNSNSWGFMSADPMAKTGWATESRYYENYWRPEEVMRVYMAGRCIGMDLPDADITAIKVSAKVSAQEAFGGRTQTGVLKKIDLVPSIISAQTFVTPDGQMGTVHGDRIVFMDGDKLTLTSTSKFGSIEAQKREEVPASFAPATTALDELKVGFASVAVTGWRDGGLPKGKKLVTVKGSQELNASGIEARLSAAVDSARAAVTTREGELSAAQTAAASAADPKAAKAALRAAEKALASAQKTLAAVERDKAKGLVSERQRLSRALSCDKVVLVTSTGVRTPSNAKMVVGACAGLAASDSAAVEWMWQLDRYEVPLAVYASVGGRPLYASVATQDTIKNDPR